ncbi:non-specific serine/threonine protein kinase [Malassezia vespertilionis]|uniref:Sch9p n=1 Tax=Malassezia vespertilionis TaxID=2020962 RepID=A0A2N1J795_9BASI|nr:non-specific serine/threonine protein kinase [Malassezia vespertilionis]PKI82410.1 hypothetical protein MVES_003605 [Malassezia vespertilionis]WFD07995.1 non-specific serine/threonine protein kinase [Malassezia vespertilionis]
MTGVSMQQDVHGLLDQDTPRIGIERDPFDALDRSSLIERGSTPNPLLTPGPGHAQVPSSLIGVPTTSVSRVAPDFTMKLPPPKPKSSADATMDRSASTSSIGYLHVQLLEARRLPVSSIETSRPFVVVQFDMNEYVGDSFDGAADADSSQPRWHHAITFDVTSRNQIAYVSVYDRQGTQETLLGLCEIRPRLIHRSTAKQWYTLYTHGDESGEASETRGEILIQMSYERVAQHRLGTADFEFLKLIGRGTFGRVFQVRKRDTKRIYAMKVLSKREIAMKKEVTHTMGERKILEQSLLCPFLVGLKFSFQSESELFFVTDYKSGGELFWHLQREGRFTEARARFYIAELTLALEHLHKYNIVYRDLKPENILLDATGHVALCDFGLSKADLQAGQLTNTFCGTTEYLAPEILLDETGYSKLVDFWSLGVLLFEMCCGWSPFYADDTQQMYRNICFGKIKFPRGAIGDEGKQFVKGLLNRNPRHRLGAHADAQDLKNHAFFASIDWDALARKQIPPVFKPLVVSDECVANFDPEFTESSVAEIAKLAETAESLAVSKGDSVMRAPPMTHSKSVAIGERSVNEAAEPLSRSVQEKFRGFSYTGTYDGVESVGLERFGAVDWGTEDAATEEEWTEEAMAKLQLQA